MKSLICALFLSVFIIIGCSSESAPTPEEQIKAWIVSVEHAVKAKSVSKLKQLISPDYRDSQGYDRQKLLMTIRLIFSQNNTIGISNEVIDVWVSDNTALLKTVTSFSGSQLGASFKSVSGADTYSFRINLVKKDKKWQATSIIYSNN